MKRLLLIIGLALTLAAPALAAQPALTGTISIDQTGPYHYGDSVTFTTSYSIKGNAHPMVEVACYQDLNGDGTVDTSLFGPDLAWVRLDHPDATFTLGVSSATCRATLYAYGWKGQQEFIIPLDSTLFAVE